LQSELVLAALLVQLAPVDHKESPLYFLMFPPRAVAAVVRVEAPKLLL
jgi:hypothetical protein